ncbi:transposase [Coleofasciculus sp. FACHB-129]|nr:transposase [Coleofasciculus sp. FACHB-SPT9]MBD1895860.1 transposase [Coleofasciculus sp. FACHB-129]
MPAYSPAFNKIERCWSWLKSRIRKQLDQARLSTRCNGACPTPSVLTALAVAIILLHWSEFRERLQTRLIHIQCSKN